MGGGVAQEERCRRCDHGAVCGRLCAGISAPRRRAAFSGAVAEAHGGVRAGTTLGENTPDSIRAIRGRVAEAGWGGETGDVQLSGMHAYLQQDLEQRQVYGTAQDGGEANDGETAEYRSAAAQTPAPPDCANRPVAGPGAARILQLSRHTGQSAAAVHDPAGNSATLAVCPTAAESTQPVDVGALRDPHYPVSARAKHPTSSSFGAVSRQASEIRAV